MRSLILSLVRRMTTELRLLVASVILGLVQLIVASHLISFQYGYRWTGGSRDEPVPPLRGLANRVDQATTNFLETFPFFATLVLAAHFTNHHGLLTRWGAHLYFWGRLGYFLASVVGYGLTRSISGTQRLRVYYFSHCASLVAT